MRPIRPFPAGRAAGALAAALAVLTAAACGSGPSPHKGAPETLPTATDELVELARDEGGLVIGAGGHTRDQITAVADAFEETYDIPVTHVRETSGQIAQKVQAELSSNSLSFDVVSLNDEATMRTWREDGVLAPLAVPNVGDIRGVLTPEPPQAYVPFAWSAMGYAYNEARTPDGGAPVSWAGLAQRNGKFAVANPSSSGAALTFASALQDREPGLLKGVGDTGALASDSALALTQLLATGEADYGLPGIEPDVTTARKAGEPLKMGYPDGPIPVMVSYVAATKDAPNPASARLFLQFQLGEQAQRGQADVGSRSVLAGTPPPTDMVDIPDGRLVVLGADDLEAGKDEVRAAFDSAVGGR